MIQDYFVTHRLSPGTSLFYAKRPKNKCPANRIRYHCTCDCGQAQQGACENPKVNCNFKGIANRPKFRLQGNDYKTLDFPGAEHCGRRRRRAIRDSNHVFLPDDEDFANYTYNPDSNENYTIPGWPTATGKTKSQAEAYCRTTLVNSPAGQACSKLPSFSMEKYVRQCVEDVEVSIVKRRFLHMSFTCRVRNFRQ